MTKYVRWDLDAFVCGLRVWHVDTLDHRAAAAAAAIHGVVRNLAVLRSRHRMLVCDHRSASQVVHASGFGGGTTNNTLDLDLVARGRQTQEGWNV